MTRTRLFVGVLSALVSAGVVCAGVTNQPAAAKKRGQAIRWKMPVLEGVNANDSVVVTLAINADGSRVLAKGKKQVCLFDVASTNVIRRFMPPTNQWNKSPGTDRMFVSDDAQVVATYVEGAGGKGARMLFQDAESGEKLGGPVEAD